MKMIRLLRSCRIGAVAAGVLSVCLTAVQAQTPVRRLSAVPDSAAARMALPSSVSGRIAAATVVGHLPGSTPLTNLSLMLAATPDQNAALDQLLADQQNPASPQYHQWLTPEQFGARFGAADGDIAILESWLQARGFTVDHVVASRNRIVFSGTASAVESAFGVSLQQYHLGTQTFFENSTAVQLPASFAGVVDGVRGLSSYRAQVSHAVSRPLLDRLATPEYTAGNGTHYLVPGDFKTIFGIRSLTGFDGTGVTIGIIGQSAVDTQQLTYFQQKTGQTVKLPTMVLMPNTGVSNRIAGDEGESELDLEYSSGIAPGATVEFIYPGCGSTVSSTPLTSSSSCNYDVSDALAFAIQDITSQTSNRLPQIISLSYGYCEPSVAPAITTSSYTYQGQTYTGFETILKQGTAQGQTIIASSGDNGAATCDPILNQSNPSAIANQGLNVSWPASSPSVTGVGGTQLNDSGSSSYWSSSNSADLSSATSYIPEVSWNDSGQYAVGSNGKQNSASGGGVSQVFTKPSWQGGTGVPADGMRDVPDVAFPAAVEHDPYLICSASGPCTSTAGFGSGAGGGGLVGGTSVAAPNFAAMLAVIEQANGGGSLGNVNPILYTLAQGTSAGTIFHDITAGNNLINCQTGSLNCNSTTAQTSNCPLTGTAYATTYCIGYTAGVGYDLVTGLGSINAPALRTALQSVTAKTAALSLTASATSPGVGSSVTFTLNVGAANGSSTVPTGTVQFAVDGTNVGSAVTLNGGSASYIYSGFITAGSHTVTAVYGGDSNYNSGTATLNLTSVVTTPTMRVTVAPTTVNINTSFTVTATLTGGGSLTPAGTVSFTINGTQYTATLSGGVATYTMAAGLPTAGVYTITGNYAGNAQFAAATGTASLTVMAPTQTLTPTLVLSANNSVTTNTPLNFTLAASGTGGAPTGNYTVLVDGAAVGSPKVLTNGSGSFSYTFTTAGSHTVQAQYGGDNQYKAANSNTATITVTPSTFSMAFTPASMTVAYGGTGSGTLTLTAGSGFSDTINFKAGVTAGSGGNFAGCITFNPSAPALAAGGTATVAVQLQPTNGSCTLPGARSQVVTANQQSQWTRTGLGAIAAAGLFGCFFLRRRARVGVLMAIGLMAMTFGMSGCGSGSSSVVSRFTGNYTITITGTAASNNSVTASTSFAVTVN